MLLQQCLFYGSDINECNIQNVCPADSNCINFEGSYVCACNSGFTKINATCIGNGIFSKYLHVLEAKVPYLKKIIETLNPWPVFQST